MAQDPIHASGPRRAAGHAGDGAGQPNQTGKSGLRLSFDLQADGLAEVKGTEEQQIQGKTTL